MVVSIQNCVKTVNENCFIQSRKYFVQTRSGVTGRRKTVLSAGLGKRINTFCSHLKTRFKAKIYQKLDFANAWYHIQITPKKKRYVFGKQLKNLRIIGANPLASGGGVSAPRTPRCYSLLLLQLY